MPAPLHPAIECWLSSMAMSDIHIRRERSSLKQPSCGGCDWC